MRVAFDLASNVLPMYFSRFSRHDFTVPQLFACLILKEHQRKTYRDVEALLRDAPHWCRDLGMKKVPDHNTLADAGYDSEANHQIARHDMGVRSIIKAGIGRPGKSGPGEEKGSLLIVVVLHGATTPRLCFDLLAAWMPADGIRFSTAGTGG